MRTLALFAVCLALVPACQNPAASRFQPAAPSSGTVVDESGKPLAGVRYWLSGFEERTANGWRVAHFSGIAEMRFTREDGRFEVPQRDGLRSDVDFDRSGFSPVFVQQLESGQEIRVVMRRGLDVRGRVRQRTSAGERPAEGARVAIRRPNPRGLWFETEVLTDAQGEFVFQGFLTAAVPGALNAEADSAPAESGWELLCSGAAYDLPERLDRPLDDLRIDVAIRRGP